MALAKMKMRLRIVTPWEAKVDEMVDMVIFRSVGGEMGVLPQHESYLCALTDGVFRIMNDGGERKMAVLGGVCEIRENVVTVLSDEVHWPEEIDRAGAQALQQQIEKKLQDEKLSVQETRQDLAQLNRARVQLEVSDFSSQGR